MAGKSHARTRKTELNDRWRDKIRASMIINRLVNHLDGKVELSTSQVRAAEIILKKIVPDLQAIGGSDLMPALKAAVTVKFGAD